jgi:hypothetical protein
MKQPTTQQPTAPKVIGLETTYIGHDRRHGGHGVKVLITAIFKYHPDPAEMARLGITLDPEAPHAWIADNELLARAGGVQPGDGAEIHMWIEKESRWCMVADELRDIRQLEAFKNLR